MPTLPKSVTTRGGEPPSASSTQDRKDVASADSEKATAPAVFEKTRPPTERSTDAVADHAPAKEGVDEEPPAAGAAKRRQNAAHAAERMLVRGRATVCW